MVTVAAGESLGRVRRHRGPAAAGSASRPSRGSPAWSAPPRSRTSARTARRSPRPSRRSGSGTASSEGVRTFANADCGFGYRTSRFKADPGRHVVLSVTFQLAPGRPGRARRLRRAGAHPRRRARAASPGADVREAVLALRRGKGMVLDAADHDTWSAGSFFTNPVVAAEVVPEGAPAWPAEGGVKTSAAWLIEHAGFAKGYGNDRVAPLHQAHAGPHQPRPGHHRRPAGARPRDPRRRGGGVRHPAGQRAGAGRLLALGAD